MYDCWFQNHIFLLRNQLLRQGSKRRHNISLWFLIIRDHFLDFRWDISWLQYQLPTWYLCAYYVILNDGVVWREYLLQFPQINAGDVDLGGNGDVIFSLEGRYAAWFDIDPLSAAVNLNSEGSSSLDRENTPNIVLEVISCAFRVFAYDLSLHLSSDAQTS